MSTNLLNVSGTAAEPLREELSQGESDDLARRRGIVALSMFGMAAMAPVSLLQTGVVRHLPDPPLPGFHSDETNLSDAAYQYGVPDGTVALAGLAANVPLAAVGGKDRAERSPWAPLAAAGFALVQALGAGKYFYRMLSGKEPWCAYCIGGAIANFGVLALSLPEAKKALANIAKR